MFLFKNDPIDDYINSTFEEIEGEQYSFEELQSLVAKARDNNDFVKSFAFSRKMIVDFHENARSWLNCFDDLMQLGYFYDAEKIIEKKYYEKSSLYGHTPHPLVVERYYDILISQYDYSKAFEIVLTNLDCLKSNARLIDKLKRDFLFCRERHGLELISSMGLINEDYQLNNSEDDVLLKFEKAVANNDGKAMVNYAWQVFSEKKYNLFFFKNATKFFPGEGVGSRRYNFFVAQAYKLYPEELDFLVLFCKSQMFLGFHEKIKYILRKIKITDILKNPNIPQIIRSDLYYIYLKNSAWLGYEDELLISHEDAFNFDLMKPYTLDLINQGSLCIERNGFLNKKFIDFSSINRSEKAIRGIWRIVENLSYEVNASNSKRFLFFSGQVRGSFEANSYMKNCINLIRPDYVSLNTWNLQNIKPPRLGRLDRYFSSDILKKIPKDAMDFEKIKFKFPLLIKKMESLSKLPISYKDFSAINFNFLKIESEDNFESGLKSHVVNFGIRGSLNQAKMFYKMCDLGDIKIGNGDAVVRSRVDIWPVFKNGLEMHVNLVGKHANNYLYANYFGPAGSLGDQFWIAGGLAFKKMTKIWTLALEYGKLAYLDVFDDYAKYHAAEDLCMAHAIAFGVNLRYIKSEGVNNFISPNLSNYCNLDDVAKDDYERLDNFSKEKFFEFYSIISKSKTQL